MKTLTIFLLLISIELMSGILVIRNRDGSIIKDCISKNRFDKEFTKADSAFTHQNDSVKFEQMMESMKDTTKITLTVNQCLQLYMHGYINGAYDYRQKGEYDIDAMWEGMIKQHKALRFQIRFFKNIK